MRDCNRSKVYAAEQVLRWMYDRSAESGNPMTEITGIPVTLPPEAKFGNLDNIQPYVDRVLALPGLSGYPMAQVPITVRRRKGDKFAHYEPPGTIAIPDHTHWAMRELVVLHEIAHHLAPRHGHDSQFVHAYLDLLTSAMGPEPALILRVLMYEHGVLKRA